MQPPADTTRVANGLDTPIKEIIDQIGMMPDTVMYVAVTVGFMLFVVGYFAGIKQNKTKMLFSALIVMLVGLFSVRVPAFIFKFMVIYNVDPTLALGITYIIWTYLLLAMAISLYETWIVTIKEQFGNSR